MAFLTWGFPGAWLMQGTQETRVQSLGQEDPLEEEVVIHSGTLPWRIPWTEEPGGLQSLRLRNLANKNNLGIYIGLDTAPEL